MATKITVLFVEDDAIIRTFLKEALPADEFHSIVASDGENALRFLTSRSVNVLVTDIVMPGMDGIELARQAKALFPDLPIILMTGYFARVEEAREIGKLLSSLSARKNWKGRYARNSALNPSLLRSSDNGPEAPAP
jgi:two-component system cell cycle response regulator CpdR